MTGSAAAPLASPQALTIPVGADTDCPAILYRAERAGAPLVLHLHAGAFTSAPPEGMPCVVRLLLGAGATVVSLQYPLAPKHPFPHAAEAAHGALLHLHKRRKAWGTPSGRLFVAGEEAGGNLAAAASLMARDRAGPELAGQILFSPMLDVCVGTASLRRAQAGPVGCRWADGWHDYLPDANAALHPYATPGSAARLSGVPATLLVTAADDAFRDETAAYAARLRQAGVAVDHLVLPPPTRFPAPYMEVLPACDTAWVEAAGQHLSRFLHGPDPEPSQTTRTRREPT
ncbi:MAG: alpha/beta hydrolase [Pseudomonadota bacterium]